MALSNFSLNRASDFGANARKFFGKNSNHNTTGLVSVPNLVTVQLKSYRDDLLQVGVEPGDRKNKGLQEAFNSIFPIHDQSATLEFVEYSLGPLRHSEDECRIKGLTFSRSVSVTVRLILWDSDEKITEDEEDQQFDNLQDDFENFKNTKEAQNDLENGTADIDHYSSTGDSSQIVASAMEASFGGSDTDASEADSFEASAKRRFTQIVEQKIYLGDIPYMTDNATFIINGIERVLISELHRAPGAYYVSDEAKDGTPGKSIFKATIIPYRGSWLECEFDTKDSIYFRVDKKRKIPAAVLFRALGMTNQGIISAFYGSTEYSRKEDGTWIMQFEPAKMGGIFLDEDIIDADQGKVVFSHNKNSEGYSGRKMNISLLQSLHKKGLKNIVVSQDQLLNSCAYEDIYSGSDKKSKLIISAGEKFTQEALDAIDAAGITNIKAMVIHNDLEPYIRNSLLIDSPRPKDLLLQDSAKNDDEKYMRAVCEVYKLVHGEGRSFQDAKKYLENLFFKGTTYDLSHVGRSRLNSKFGLDKPEDYKYLTRDDILAFTKHLIYVKDGKMKDANGREVKFSVDDIDSLENRRIRASGEIVLAYFYASMFRIRKGILEKLGGNLEGKTPQDLIMAKVNFQDIFNAKTQYMDQTNPLAEVTHKKKVTSVGQGGVSRDTVSSSLRDVHDSHYGRLCPIETPEGPNVGLILSLAVYADKNPQGFLTSPYAKVVNGKVTNEVEYLTYAQERQYCIAMDTSIINSDGTLIAKFDEVFEKNAEGEVVEAHPTHTVAENQADSDKFDVGQYGYVECRKDGNYINVSPYEVEYINIAPNQVVSSSTASVPFIENNDSTRALMGANMQRQAVPLNSLQTPVVATGMEEIIARNSTLCLVAPKACTVVYVDSESIITRDLPESEADENNLDLDMYLDKEMQASADAFGLRVYDLKKFRRSNNHTCINQSPVVRLNQHLNRGDVLANGFGVKNNELALGANVLVAMMPWNGFNYEDSIIISSKLIKDDIFTSIKIDTYEVYVRDTKLGEEEVTRDIENVSQDMLASLDENGIVNVGTEIKPGTILVGKLTPKAESSYASHEKLLNSLLHPGKSLNTKDTSFYAPFDAQGIVTSVNVFCRKGLDKNDRRLYIESQQINKLRNKKSLIIRTLDNILQANLQELLMGQIISQDIKFHGVKDFKKGHKITYADFSDLDLSRLMKLKIMGQEASNKIVELSKDYTAKIKAIEADFDQEVEKITTGEDLNQSVLMKIVITVASYSNRLQPGDKMCGRHGNKGVVAKIVPEENMPFMEDGRSIDVILNPLGVPGRMNIGQIYEIHLGLAYYYIKNQMSKLWDEYNEGKTSIKQFKEFCKQIFNTAEQHTQIDGLPEEEFKEIARDLAAGGLKFVTPVFDGAKEEDIKDLLNLVCGDTSGKVKLRSGETGEFYHAPVTVGFKYMLKLHHMVDEKIHARSTGPYSLITQQPLGGRAQFGGQRLGEMEVWALEGYGAAHCLHEFLTIKSDDIIGRNSAYANILKRGYHSLYRDEYGSEMVTSRPESYNVMSRELAALCLKLFIETDHQGAERAVIRLMSPREIVEMSGNREVTKPETINYRTYKPDRGGLFCAAIFGPMKDYECLCGKSKKTREKNAVCDKCGVEMTVSRVRRERLGCIKLAAPVVHPWFLRSTSSKVAVLLDKGLKDIEKIVYFNKYVVIDPGKTSYKTYDLIDEIEYRNILDSDMMEEGLIMESGAKALQMMLKDLNLQGLRNDLQHKLSIATTETRRRKIIRRLKLVNGFLHSDIKPEWMILEVLPVLPPDLRPLIPLDGGKFASSDLNDLYRKVISRNNRLKRFVHGGSGIDQVDIIINNEKRMLQEAVDVLFDGPKKTKFSKAATLTPIKSLSDSLKGKQGRFRQNLLGKRVDYSGRSVIVVGANLKLDECGIPKTMALELFKAWVQHTLTSRPNAHGHLIGIKEATARIKNPDDEIWSILQEVVNGKIVLLNRAPTLHRLGIQAFRARLIEGKAIQLHPLVCTAFNADFDGDQMAVHVPLSIEAQAEAEILMMYNLFNPANGRPIVAPDKDMVLGIYYLTLIDEELDYSVTKPTEGQLSGRTPDRFFASEGDALAAYEHGKIELHAPIYVRVHEQTEVSPEDFVISADIAQADGDATFSANEVNTPELYSQNSFDQKCEIIDEHTGDVTKSSDNIENNTHVQNASNVVVKRITTSRIVKTSIGRIMLWSIVPSHPGIKYEIVNKIYRKADSLDLIMKIYEVCGQGRLVQFVDDLKDLGFKFATVSGFSLGMDDMIIPAIKPSIVHQANAQIAQLRAKYEEHCITEGELNNKIIDIWSTAPETIASAMIAEMAKYKKPTRMNAFYMAFDSGARGSKQQLKQIAAMRGLIVKSTGDILTVPIKSNFKEGLSLMEYFISTHGTRKGLSDTALKTANSGYLTRKLVDVAQDCMVTKEDCGTTESITLKRLGEAGEEVALSKRVFGRVVAQDVVDTITGETVVTAGTLVDQQKAMTIEACVDQVKVRSVITCEAESGVCSKCYGMDLSSGKLMLVGEAVGIIAAQSIGEPGTQLTMRTFHIGGTATQKVEVSSITTNVSGIIRIRNNASSSSNYVFVNSESDNIVMGRSCEVIVEDSNGTEKYRHKLPYGAKLFVADGEQVASGTKLASWDPYVIPILAEKSGFVAYEDIVPGISVKDSQNELTGLSVRTVLASSKRVGKQLHPAIKLVSEMGEPLSNTNSDRYLLPPNAVILASEGQSIKAGDCLARVTKEIQKNKDIVGGLPRVSELFEARKPKIPSIVAGFDGKIGLSKSASKNNKTRTLSRSIITLEEIIDSEAVRHSISNDALEQESAMPNRLEFTAPKNQNILVQDGDVVRKGDILVDGEPVLQEKLNIDGKEGLADYFVNEVQKVYRLQGVTIDDKHIEVILKQMLSKYEITDPGDTSLCVGEKINALMYRYALIHAPAGARPPVGRPIIESITTAALNSDSFLSSAAFQYTQIVLTEAAIRGSMDYLVNPKASLMTGGLVNIGAGFRNSVLESKLELVRETVARMYNVMAEQSDDNIAA